MKTNNLAEFSSSYYEDSHIYKIFSECEDKESYIWENIKHLLVNQSVLDLGCGNGRYLEKITTLTDKAIGVDQSFQQLKQSNKDLSFITADASKLPFKNECFDIVLSCWVFGTILDLNKRLKVLSEAIRVLKPNGSIILVENDTPSEFEYYRGRHLNDKTQEYNTWLINQGFSTHSKVKTFITFDSTSIAQHVFKSIWKEKLFDIPRNNKIENNVIILKYQK